MHFAYTAKEKHMNRTIAIAIIAASAAAAGSAFAEDYNAYNPAVESTRTRAEVQAELAQFKQSGVNPSSIAYNPLEEFRGSKTRAQVVGEYLASRDRVAAFTGEDSGSSYLARNGAGADTQRFATR
jgi:hypothetical protein